MIQLGPGTFTSTAPTKGVYDGLVPYEGHSRITSIFGAYEPFRKAFKALQPDGTIKVIDIGPHKGTDFVPSNGIPARGVPTLALAPGKVTAVGQANPQPQWANYIYIEHQARNRLTRTPRIVTRSMHFKEPPTLKVGDTVKRGDVIGLTGSTGKSTGPHTHVDLWVGGERVDVMSLIVPVLELEKMSKRKIARLIMPKVWSGDYEAEFEGLEAVIRFRLDV